jgi:uncharacterized DUF497 family protein
MALEFEWDDDKASANWRRHGVEFYHAVKSFQDLFAVERVDTRQDYGEDRVNLIGMCDGVLIHVTYTERDGSIRIISARRAQSHEQDDYYRENSR